MATSSSPDAVIHNPEPEMRHHPGSKGDGTSTPHEETLDTGATASSDVSTDTGELTPSASRCSTPTQADSEADMPILTPTTTNCSSTPTEEAVSTPRQSPTRWYFTRDGEYISSTNNHGGVQTASATKNYGNNYGGVQTAVDNSTNRTISDGAYQTFDFTSRSSRNDAVHASPSSTTRIFNSSTTPDHGTQTSSGPSTAHHHHHEHLSSQTLRSGDTFTNCTLSSCSGSNLTLENCTVSSCQIKKSTVEGGRANSCGISESQISGGTYNSCSISRSGITGGEFNSCGLKGCERGGGMVRSCSVSEEA